MFNNVYRFVADLPSGWVFILFCTLLRMTEGVGSAMFFTATFTLLPEYYPSRIGTLLVSTVTLVIFHRLSVFFPHQGFFELGGGFGFAVGPVIGGLLYQLGGFRLPFLIVGSLVLLFVIPCIILVRPSGICIRSTVCFKGVM